MVQHTHTRIHTQERKEKEKERGEQEGKKGEGGRENTERESVCLFCSLNNITGIQIKETEFCYFPITLQKEEEWVNHRNFIKEFYVFLTDIRYLIEFLVLDEKVKERGK